MLQQFGVSLNQQQNTSLSKSQNFGGPKSKDFQNSRRTPLPKNSQSAQKNSIPSLFIGFNL